MLETPNGTSRDKLEKSYVKSLQRDGKTAQEVVIGNSASEPVIVNSTVKWDSLEASFPASNQDLWTYKLNSQIVMTVLVTYASPDKNNIIKIDKEIF